MYHIIIAGGSGTRFWPYSREKKPKQLLKIVDKTSLIRLTVDRLLSFVKSEKIYIVANRELCKFISDEIPEISRNNFIIEPSGKNTAPAIGLAAIHIYKKDPEGIMAIYPADQIIKGKTDFKNSILEAEKIINNKPSLIALGIKPTYPATGYGYVQFNNIKKKPENYFKVKTFAEKPPYNIAEKFIKSGDFLWNSGIFIWQAEIILLEFKTFLPELHDSLSMVFDAIDTNQYELVLKREWKIVQSISIDYGILEKAKNVYIIPVNFEWVDMGSWKAFYDYNKKNKNGNVTKGKVIVLDTTNSLVMSPDRLTAILGVDNLVVINTEDVTLILPKDKSEDVKNIINNLKENNKKEYI